MVVDSMIKNKQLLNSVSLILCKRTS